MMRVLLALMLGIMMILPSLSRGEEPVKKKNATQLKTDQGQGKTADNLSSVVPATLKENQQDTQPTEDGHTAPSSDRIYKVQVKEVPPDKWIRAYVFITGFLALINVCVLAFMWKQRNVMQGQLAEMKAAREQTVAEMKEAGAQSRELITQAREQVAALLAAAQAAEKSAIATEKTAIAAKASADAAREGVEVTISKERARLKIGVQDINLQSQSSAGEPVINGALCWVSNYGFTTAFISDFRGRFCQSDTPDIAADYAQCRQVIYAESIQPNKFSPQYLLPLEPSPTLADDDLLKIRKGESFLHFYGFVKHRDVFNRDWQTTIHMRWTMRWGGVIKGTITEWWQPVGPPEENKETNEKNTT